ncbi:MAG: hypothetical protein ACK46L_03825 [Synechococcaceae cyanobacterium]|jgi:hypothetical protein
MTRLLQRQHKPRLPQSTQFSLSLRFGRLPRPLFPACAGPLPPAEQSSPWSYWRRQARREALLAALFTTLLTSAVQAAPQLFSQSPVQSLQDMKALLLPGSAGLRLPMLDDCP